MRPACIVDSPELAGPCPACVAQSRLSESILAMQFDWCVLLLRVTPF
jgi:hypothetical protein